MINNAGMQETRKRDHIDLTEKAQSAIAVVDERFYYEPLFSAHPNESTSLKINFLNKTLKAPFWISSMTGGVGPARHINQNLAKVAREFGLGMGLGSCRTLLESNQYFEDFNLRPVLGEELPFFANLGVAQLEELFATNTQNKILELLKSLSVDGLIMHINPMQEWFQPEGDRFLVSPFETLLKLKELLAPTSYKLIVKEVGQGFGPKSLEALVKLEVDAIELAGFGGTNFSKLEVLRDKDSLKKQNQALVNVGHTPLEMIQVLNQLSKINHKMPEIIISGGVKDYLDAYYLNSLSFANSVCGMAKNFLSVSENYDDLRTYVESQIEGYKMAAKFLNPKISGDL